jgi:hypothetical protein
MVISLMMERGNVVSCLMASAVLVFFVGYGKQKILIMSRLNATFLFFGWVQKQ